MDFRDSMGELGIRRLEMKLRQVLRSAGWTDHFLVKKNYGYKC